VGLVGGGGGFFFCTTRDLHAHTETHTYTPRHKKVLMYWLSLREIGTMEISGALDAAKLLEGGRGLSNKRGQRGRSRVGVEV